MSALSPPTRDRLSTEEAWFVASRWQQLDGEYRANYLRIVSVIAFYVVHSLEYYQLLGFMGLAPHIGRAFHVAVTVIAMAWLLVALAVDVLLRQKMFPAAMPYVTTTIDLVLLTAVLCLGSGQQSPLVLAYPVILVFAAIRFDLTLIRYATLGAAIAFLYLMAVGRWPALIGGREIEVLPRYAQLMTLLAIGITGIALGQMIRRFRHLAEYYARRSGGEATDVS